MEKTSMMYVSEWLVFLLPELAAMTVAGLLFTISVKLMRVRTRERSLTRTGVQTLSAVLAVPGAMALLVAGIWLSINPFPMPISSPDRHKVADYTYQSGFLGRDATRVKVRSVSSIVSHDAYVHYGPDCQNCMRIRWLSNTDLEIRYFPDADHRQWCLDQSGEVHVHCLRSAVSIDPTEPVTTP